MKIPPQAREYCFVVLFAIAVAAAVAFRIPSLEKRPFHADEAVHAYKVDALIDTGEYQYDPNEFHGPTLYYFTLPLVWLSGARDSSELDEVAYRMTTVLFGIGILLLLLLLRDALGPSAIVWTAAFMALSTGIVFMEQDPALRITPFQAAQILPLLEKFETYNQVVGLYFLAMLEQVNHDQIAGVQSDIAQIVPYKSKLYDDQGQSVRLDPLFDRVIALCETKTAD